MAVEHDPLHVHFGPAHAQAVRAGKILSGHRIGLQDKPRNVSSAARRARLE
jgi:hypothetical protein